MPTVFLNNHFLKDHLGSIRVRVNSTGVLDGYDSYYPYGMQMNGLCSTTGLDVRYKFTGKERDTETNYDYFACPPMLAGGVQGITMQG